MNHPEQTKAVSSVDTVTDLQKPEDLQTLIMHDIGKYYLYISNSNYISYIDDPAKFTRPSNFSKIYQEVNRVEMLADQVLGGHKTKNEKFLRYKENIAQAFGGVLLNNDDLDISLETLQQIQAKIKEEGLERIRLAYLLSAFSATGLVIISIFLAWIYADRVKEILHSTTAFEVLIASLTGGLGSFISSFASFKKYHGNILSGTRMHKIDGLFRVFYGLIAGFVVCLAVKANVVGGLLGGSFGGLIFIAAIAGASEFFIPSLVAKMDSTLLTPSNEREVKDDDAKTSDKDKDDKN